MSPQVCQECVRKCPCEMVRCNRECCACDCSESCKNCISDCPCIECVDDCCECH